MRKIDIQKGVFLVDLYTFAFGDVWMYLTLGKKLPERETIIAFICQQHPGTFKSLHRHPERNTFKIPGNNSRLEYAGLPVFACGCGKLLATNASCFSDKTSVVYILGSGIHLLFWTIMRLSLPFFVCQLFPSEFCNGFNEQEARITGIDTKQTFFEPVWKLSLKETPAIALLT
jgi:hypothetical protein